MVRLAYLASEQCALSGAIMTAGAGHIAMDRMEESIGVTFDATTPLSADDIAERVAEIADFEGATPFESGHHQLLKISGFA